MATAVAGRKREGKRKNVKGIFTMISGKKLALTFYPKRMISIRKTGSY